MVSDFKQSQAARYIALGLPKVRVAEITGVSHNTITRWLKDPDFASMVETKQREYLAEVDNHIKELLASALAIVEQVLSEKVTEIKSDTVISIAWKIIDRFAGLHAKGVKSEGFDYSDKPVIEMEKSQDGRTDAS